MGRQALLCGVVAHLNPMILSSRFRYALKVLKKKTKSKVYYYFLHVETVIASFQSSNIKVQVYWNLHS